ncbi:MAG: efflux RND transporter periplasmic adaptor subunit [Candidatus Xenobiia bacterium LiM19]
MMSWQPCYKSAVIMMLLCILMAGCGTPSSTEGGAGEGSSDKPPESSEQAITLTEEQVKTAGIVVSPLRLTDVKERIEITGELEAVSTLEARVTSRLTGKVVSLPVQEGVWVHSGDSLALLESTELTQADQAYHRAKAELDISAKNLARVRDMAKLGMFSKSAIENARNDSAETRASLEGARASLDLAQKNHDRVKELFSSGIAARKDLEKSDADLAKAKADEKSARTRYESATSRLSREELNYRQGHGASKEVFEAELAYRQAEAEYESAVRSFEILGVSESNHGRTFSVTSPLDGEVSVLSISQGEAVVPTTPLMTVIDTRTLWLQANIYEKDLNKVHTGSHVYFTVSAHPGRTFTGKVSFISPLMDEKTRNVKARVQVSNSDKSLKLHMPARGWINCGSQKRALMVPKSAIVKLGNDTLVYIEKDKRGSYLPRPVSLGVELPDLVELKEGVKTGERVVTKGGFYLKSESQKASMGEEE